MMMAGCICNTQECVSIGRNLTVMIYADMRTQRVVNPSPHLFLLYDNMVYDGTQLGEVEGGWRVGRRDGRGQFPFYF